MNENGSMPTPRYIDIEAFKVSYKMAIYAGLEALKDKPIERDKAIAVMYTVFEALDAFPTATIESTRHDWTPCAEWLPEKVDKRLWSRDVLATIKQKTGNCFVVVAYYHYGHEQWKTDDMTDNDAIDVLAWQPLPEPYNHDHKEDAKSDDVSQWPEWKQRAALSNYELGKED